MTDSARPVRSWAPVNWTLLGLVLLALVAYLLVLVRGAAVLPGTSPAQAAANRYTTVTDAARTEARDFLTVDYTKMDALQARVLANATGPFKKQYAATKVNLKASAQATKTKATPTVREVAINKLAGGQATVFVAADLVRSNVNTASAKATKACPHAGATCLYFRFKLVLTDTPTGWKLSAVDFIS